MDTKVTIAIVDKDPHLALDHPIRGKGEGKMSITIHLLHPHNTLHGDIETPIDLEIKGTDITSSLYLFCKFLQQSYSNTLLLIGLTEDCREILYFPSQGKCQHQSQCKPHEYPQARNISLPHPDRTGSEVENAGY